MPSTTKKPSASAKPAAAAARANKPAKQPKPRSTAPVSALDGVSFPPDLGPEDKKDVLKIKDLLAAVAQKTGMKKSVAKEVRECVLAEMAAALSQGRPLSLPPLGNLRVAKIQEKGEAKMLVIKLRIGGTNASKDSAKDSLAQDDSDS